MEKIAVLRFSSLGDVALSVPIIKQFLEQNPNVELYYYSDKKFKGLLNNISRCHFVPLDIKNDYKNVFDLRKIAVDMQKKEITHLADLHNVIRTKVIKFFLMFSSIKIKTIDKQRKQRRFFLEKKIPQLEPISKSYATVFQKLSFACTLNEPKLEMKTVKQVGIAPFAAFEEKILPMDTMQSIIETLTGKGISITLFGAGEKEWNIMKKWKINQVQVYQSKGLQQELEDMKKLDLMICMDSANMHLASMVGVPVVSIWGATSPLAGFLGWGQSIENCVLHPIDCHPCSIFGNKKCSKNEIECLNKIEVNTVINKIKL